MMTNKNGFILLSSLLILAAMVGGCKSPPVAAEGSIAWVEISGHSHREITQATTMVLAKHGYRTLSENSEQMTYEKPGSAWNEIKDGNWGEGVNIRVQLFLTPQINEAYMLHCQVFYVRSSGDRVFEDKRKVWRMSRGPYQKLLDEVKASLETPDQPKTAKKGSA
jgi:hypothetical protein